MNKYNLTHLEQLETEAIHIIRETVAGFKNPVMLYSIGKDSSVMLHLARKAFYPVKIPFPLLHIDTGFKFPDMIKFRDEFTKKIGVKLIVERNEKMISKGMHPQKYGVDVCCQHLKTQALLDALLKHNFDAAFGGARRDEEKSRAKERIFSIRGKMGGWNPKKQRPELWNTYNTELNENESMRVFPLSNWTEVDIWTYIQKEKIEIVPLYFAQKRKVIEKQGILIPVDDKSDFSDKENIKNVKCRFRSLGCSPCTGAVKSSVEDVSGIIEELIKAKKSERENRIIDFSSDSSMEDKKEKGYF